MNEQTAIELTNATNRLIDQAKTDVDYFAFSNGASEYYIRKEVVLKILDRVKRYMLAELELEQHYPHD